MYKALLHYLARVICVWSRDFEALHTRGPHQTPGSPVPESGAQENSGKFSHHLFDYQTHITALARLKLKKTEGP